jgi:hypothetical protein
MIRDEGNWRTIAALVASLPMRGFVFKRGAITCASCSAPGSEAVVAAFPQVLAVR